MFHAEVVAPHDATGHSAVRFCRRFLAFPHARALLVDGRPVQLGGRAFDLLMVLLGARGTLVTKEEICHRVWPFTIASECNLRVQVGILRKVLGEDRDVIKCIAGRGYILIDTDETEAACVTAPPQLSSNSGQTDIPIVGVIDDDSDVRDALGGLLRSVGLRVEVFASVQQYLESGGSTSCGKNLVVIMKYGKVFKNTIS